MTLEALEKARVRNMAEKDGDVDEAGGAAAAGQPPLTEGTSPARRWLRRLVYSAGALAVCSLSAFVSAYWNHKFRIITVV